MKIWHQQPEIKLDLPLTIIIRFLSPIQIVEVKINPIKVNTDLSRESKPVLLILIFLLGDSNTLILMKVSTGDILPPTFPSPGFNNTMASDAVGRSIIQLAENQSHSLDFILAGQQSQMDAYKEMTCSNQAREDDALFAGIEVYDGEDPSCFEGWLDAVKQACNMMDRNLRKELMKKSTGAIRETLSMMNASWTDDDIISKLRQDFSSMSTMNRAREDLKDLKQLPGQPISSYMYKYRRIHFLATGNQHTMKDTLLPSWSSSSH